MPTTKEKFYSYNGAPEKCADCGVFPGSLHKSTCTGGCHDISHYKAHAYRGYADGSACYVCGARRGFGVHLKAARG